MHFSLTADDLQWMRNRLKRTVRIFMALVTLNLLVHAQAGWLTASPAASTVIEEVEKGQSRAELAEALTEAGWRKTSRGWEHISQWPQPKANIDHLVAEDIRSATSVDRWLDKIASLSPAQFAVLQVLAIGAIARVSRRATTAANPIAPESAV